MKNSKSVESSKVSWDELTSQQQAKYINQVLFAIDNNLAPANTDIEEAAKKIYNNRLR